MRKSMSCLEALGALMFGVGSMWFIAYPILYSIGWIKTEGDGWFLHPNSWWVPIGISMVFFGVYFLFFTGRTTLKGYFIKVLLYAIDWVTNFLIMVALLISVLMPILIVFIILFKRPIEPSDFLGMLLIVVLTGACVWFLKAILHVDGGLRDIYREAVRSTKKFLDGGYKS
jgi:hypothetical protein